MLRNFKIPQTDFRVNNRKYTFGNEEGAYDWVCSKVPQSGRIKKDCVPKVYQNIDKNPFLPW